jgi:hypothetical protein
MHMVCLRKTLLGVSQHGGEPKMACGIRMAPTALRTPLELVGFAISGEAQEALWQLGERVIGG